MGVQFVLRNSLAPIQFLDTPVNLRVDCMPVRSKPFVMLVQDFKRPVNHFVGAVICPRAHRFRNAMLLIRLEMNRHVSPLLRGRYEFGSLNATSSPE